MSPASAPSPTVWFIDTATLLNMALFDELHDVVTLLCVDPTDRVMFADVVHDELVRRAGLVPPDSLAARALANSSWMGSPVGTSRYVVGKDVLKTQLAVAGGKALAHESEHWAESVLITMMRAASDRGAAPPMVFLSDDHSARIQANKIAGVAAKSIHILLWELVQRDVIDSSDAERLSAVIEHARRGSNVSAAEFAAPTRHGLGRHGRP